MFQRILAIIQKEFSQALRDRSTLAVMLTMPLIQLILFGYAINTNVRNIPTVVADQSLDEGSRNFINAMVDSGYFQVVGWRANQSDVIRAIDAGQASVGIVIPPDYGEHLIQRDAQVLVLVDGSDYFTSQSAYSAANAIGVAEATQIVLAQVNQAGQLANTGPVPSLETDLRILYNPDMKDLWFIIPGLAAMLLQTQTIVLTAAAVVRERELGTIEQILVTPIRPMELMLGKIVPNLGIAMFNMFTVIGLGVFLFHVPFQGSILLFIGLAFVYVFNGLGLGLVISTVSDNQRQAQQLILLFTMVALVLGGFIFPRYTMPLAIRLVGDLFPVTYFVPISRGIITKGIGLQTLGNEVLSLLAYLLVVLFLAVRTFRERLE
ncbi:MAG: ABC transporter permease [Anaerolineales bacterium]|jgi:ABC-2 type transport system permease protein